MTAPARRPRTAAYHKTHKGYYNIILPFVKSFFLTGAIYSALVTSVPSLSAT